MGTPISKNHASELGNPLLLEEEEVVSKLPISTPSEYFGFMTSFEKAKVVIIKVNIKYL